MSTFVVRLVRSEEDPFRGRVRHVGSGEEAFFNSPEELLSFLEGMHVIDGIRMGEDARGED